MRSDSSTALGTLVQGGAAIVAIVVGLLVARIASLSAEREVWDRRVRELRRTLQTKLNNVDRARSAALSHDANRFIDAIWKSYMKDYPNANVEAL